MEGKEKREGMRIEWRKEEKRKRRINGIGILVKV